MPTHETEYNIFLSLFLVYSVHLNWTKWLFRPHYSLSYLAFCEKKKMLVSPELDNAKASCKSQEMINVVGDLNSKVGKKKDW